MANKPELDQLFNLKAAFPTEEEKTAFFAAAEKNDVKTLGKILDKWPDAPKKWERYGDSVVNKHLSKMTEKTLDYLVRRGASLDQFDKDNFWSPLGLAAFHGKLEDVEKLLRCGASVDLENKYGQTPLHWAADKGHHACADLLVLCGAHPDKGLGASRDEDMKEVIRAASGRRQSFLDSMNPSPPVAEPGPAPASEPEPVGVPIASDTTIRLMRRLELKKNGHDIGPEEAPLPANTDPSAHKPWLKRIFRF